MLDQIRIVLSHTSHPGNIGSVARAMKTMGLGQLYLVNPVSFPHQKADELASNAIDVLQNAVVCSTLEEAVGDCHLVVGTSTRVRSIPWPLSSPREMAEKIASGPGEAKIAIIFGRENSGMTNDELQRCHQHINIPANPVYSSLNLAAAVQIIAYECRIASLNEVVREEWDNRYATADEMENLFNHLQAVLVEVNFLKESTPRKLMTRLRRLFLRAKPDEMEVSILRGVLTAIQQSKK